MIRKISVLSAETRSFHRATIVLKEADITVSIKSRSNTTRVAMYLSGDCLNRSRFSAVMDHDRTGAGPPCAVGQN